MTTSSKLQPDPIRNNQDGVAVATPRGATTTDPSRLHPALLSHQDHNQNLLGADDLELLRLSNLIVKERYGNSFKVFGWSYLVVASPVPSSSVSSRGKSDHVIKNMLESVFADLFIRDGHPPIQTVRAGEDSNNVRYAYSLETGPNGWRHAHVLLGNISRLHPDQVAAVFQEHLFGAVTVDLWNPLLEKGYPFKSFDPSSPDHDRAFGDFNVKWNRRCKQEMKLHRSHLLRSVPPNASFWAVPTPRQTHDIQGAVSEAVKLKLRQSRKLSSPLPYQASLSRSKRLPRRLNAQNVLS
jgi:hypothetical protein